MPHWYPKRQRARELASELQELEPYALELATDLARALPAISVSLRSALQIGGFPARQIPQWIWVASQFRLNAGTQRVVTMLAGSALMFLERRLNKGIETTDVQELNWVLESTLQKLGEILQPDALRSCLSPEELTEIERKLTSYSDAPFDVAVVRSEVQHQVEELRALSTDGHLTTLQTKVEALFSASTRQGSDGNAARAALLYLADEHDVVRDTAHFLGLLDDIYVIEWAYAVVEAQTRCLPLLRALLHDYSFVADVAMIGDPTRPLDYFGQYVACACLEALFGAKSSYLLVTREVGPFAIISAFFAAVQVARLGSRVFDRSQPSWQLGEHLLIGDDAVAWKVTYCGVVNLPAGKRYKLGVRQRGTLLVSTDLSPYMARAPKPHARLSLGNDISEWVNGLHVDPLVHLTGAPRSRASTQECVLLLGPRHKLDLFIHCLRPLGSTPAALLGVRYIAGDHQSEDLKGSATDTPYIYACSDADTAYDLIRRPPDNVSNWRVIVDGARSARALRAALASDGDGKNVPLCVLAELYDKEPAAELADSEMPVWFLEDQDVEAPPLVAKKSTAGDDAVVRVLNRQANHWVTNKRIHDIRNPFLEALAEWMQESVSSDQDDALRGLELAAARLMQQCLAWPIASAESDMALSKLARNIWMQAGLLRQYKAAASKLHGIFDRAVAETAVAYERSKDVCSVAATVPHDESVAVLCRSARIAGECQTAIAANPLIGRFSWINMEELRRTAPYDRIIVPSWINRLTMRELATNGYATHLDFVLLPFERRWFESTIAANNRWERRIEQKTLGPLAALTSRVEHRTQQATLWRGQTKERLNPSVAPITSTQHGGQSDLPEFERLEARAVEALHHTIWKGRELHPTAKAQLVLFEEPGAYAYLPPGGKVIVLSGRVKASATDTLAARDAERILFTSVAALQPGYVLAFPLGSDRDLVDARADEFIPKAPVVRADAALWKTALKRFLQANRIEVTAFADQLKEAGQPRGVATIRSWISNSQAIAPRNFRETIPLLARLTGDPELVGKCHIVLEAADLIYRARDLAALAIVKELFAGEIDLTSEKLVFELHGAKVSYALHRVHRLEGIQDVPQEVIGRVGSMDIPSTVTAPSAAPT